MTCCYVLNRTSEKMLLMLRRLDAVSSLLSRTYVALSQLPSNLKSALMWQRACLYKAYPLNDADDEWMMTKMRASST